MLRVHEYWYGLHFGFRLKIYRPEGVALTIHRLETPTTPTSNLPVICILLYDYSQISVLHTLHQSFKNSYHLDISFYSVARYEYIAETYTVVRCASYPILCREFRVRIVAKTLGALLKSRDTTD